MVEISGNNGEGATERSTEKVFSKTTMGRHGRWVAPGGRQSRW